MQKVAIAPLLWPENIQSNECSSFRGNMALFCQDLIGHNQAGNKMVAGYFFPEKAGLQMPD